MLKSRLKRVLLLPFFATFLVKISACDTPSGNEKIRSGSGQNRNSPGEAQGKATANAPCNDKQIFDLYKWVEQFKATPADTHLVRRHLVDLGLSFEGQQSHKAPQRLLQQRLIHENLSLTESSALEAYANETLIQVLEPSSCESIAFFSAKNDNQVTGFDIDLRKSTLDELVLSNPKGHKRIYKKIDESTLLIRTETPEQRFDCARVHQIIQSRTYIIQLGTNLSAETMLSAELVELINLSLAHSLIELGEDPQKVKSTDLNNIQKAIQEESDLLRLNDNDEASLKNFKMVSCPAQ